MKGRETWLPLCAALLCALMLAVPPLVGTPPVKGALLRSLPGEGIGSSRLYAAVFIVRGSVAGSPAGGYGVYVRGERDTTWTRITRSSTLAFGIGYFDKGRTRRLYMAGGNGVHRSTDGGTSWRILTTWRTEEILCVVPDPVDSSVIYAATPFGVFKTIDDGPRWERRMEGIPTRFVQRVVMDERDRRTLYALTEADLFRSTDAAGHWHAMGSGLTQVLAFLQHPVHAEIMIAAGEDSAMRRSTDGGKSWSRVRGLGPSSIYTLRSSRTGADLYAAGWKTGIWRSTDEGASWQQVWDAQGIDAIYSLFVYPDDPAHILAGTVGRGVFESLDRGATWRSAGLEGTQVKQIELYP